MLVPLAYNRYQEAQPFQHLLDEAIELDAASRWSGCSTGPVMIEAMHQMSSGRYEEARSASTSILRASRRGRATTSHCR